MATSLYLRASDTFTAVRLINLGARLCVLERELNLSRETLIKLYIEISGSSPPKGLLPFSADWFMTWKNNIHSSLFMNYYIFFSSRMNDSNINMIIRAYEMYMEELLPYSSIENGNGNVLSITRAWIMVGMFKGREALLKMVTCVSCQGSFVTHFSLPTPYVKRYVCGLCNMPSRAGKTKRSKVLV